ncbi:beta-lactamase family protein [Nocardioides sp. zg-ZUI104]|nr:beta-lactamase family protein [Nocardioides faecalis]
MGSDPQPYDAVLARLQAAGRLPSVVAAVARGGEPVWSGALSVDPTGPEVSPGTSYRTGSITKTLTAVLVLQLRDEGQLGLDDPVGRFVGEAGGYGDVSLTRLLSHTGGLQSEPVGSWWERTGSGGAAALLAANDGAGRVAAAGEWFHYSNLGYALLGEVVARLRGVSWWQAVRERLLEPLGMSATDYHPPADHAPGRSVDHFAHTLTPSRSPTPGRWRRPGSCGARPRTCCAGPTSWSPGTPTCWVPPRWRRWRVRCRPPRSTAWACAGPSSVRTVLRAPRSGDTPAPCRASWRRCSWTAPPGTRPCC